MKKDGKRNYYIDFLKLIFSIVIVCYHSWLFTGNFGSGYFNRGFYAVDFYFIVTGFLFIKSLEKISKKKSREPVGLLDIKFIFSKVKDLLPIILLIYILGYFMVYERAGFNHHILSSDNVVSEFFFLGFIGKGMSINSSCWYIAVMLLVLFILFPIGYKYKKNFNYYISPLIIILCLAICNFFNVTINDPLAENFIFINGFYKGLIFINLGVISYELCNYISKISPVKSKRIYATILETLIYVILLLNMHYNIMENYLTGVLFTFNIALTFSNLSYTADLFNSKLFQKLGKFGFVLYLSNVPIRTFVLREYNGSYYKLFLIYWVLIIIISLITYCLSEIVTKKLEKRK